MLLNLPFQGSATVLRPFGSEPAADPGVTCEGVPLRGHEGIDFALPAGTPVRAVSGGAVLAIDQDPRSGRFILLGHPWGQSYYAQLAAVSVGVGESVSAGQPIGTSGMDAATSTPHLHFGLRIAPFSRADGWCGYSDPQPIIDRIDTPRGPILGPHILGGVHRHLPLLERWQPRLILIVDPNPDEMRLLRQTCPNTTIVGRIFAPDGEVSDRIRANSAEAARWAHELVRTRLSPQVDYWQIANEVLSQPDELPVLAAFEHARMSLAESAGYRCATFAFSVGNPDLPESNRMAHWQILYPALQRAEEMGHIVVVHQYGAPDLTHPTIDWHIHRLEHQVLRRLPFKRLQFAVTEFGIDGLLMGPEPKGWRQFATTQEYVNQLQRAGRYLERFSGRVLGYAVYSLGVTGPWSSYDIDGEVSTLLAETSERGTWKQVNTESGGLDALDADTGGEAGDDSGGSTPSNPTEPSEPAEPAEPTEPTPPSPTIVRRISPWVEQYNMAIKTIAERPDNPVAGDVEYLIKDVFTTANGSWEVSDAPGSIPQWARDAYLTSEFLEAGADHHLFAAVLGLNGKLMTKQPVKFWSDGFERLADGDYDGYVTEETKEQSGWANLVIFSGSAYEPEQGESGPWCWTPAGRAEVMTGGGLPANQHISVFVVWQAVQRNPTEPPPAPPPPLPKVEPTSPTTPKPVTPTPPPAGFVRRVGTWIDHLNLSVKTVAERPDKPPGDIIYVVRDIFTTRDGSWEPSNQMGAVDGWARDAYLKAWGAPDYFDDAGADHHIFAAVLGLDGQLLRDFEILYWSDGFEQLGNPNYAGYVSRNTKSQSGWANIPMDGGASYGPERGEQGPWCWAPKGAAEVAVGAGMPLKNHVSFFVVWQAVKRPTPHVIPGDVHVFLPWISTPGVVPSQELPLPPGAGLPEARQEPGAHPAPPSLLPPPVEDPQLGFLREDAWLRVGVESTHDSALATYARRVGLGMPVTHEFSSGGFVAQGFAGAIVFAPLDDLEEIHHIAW